MKGDGYKAIVTSQRILNDLSSAFTQLSIAEELYNKGEFNEGHKNVRLAVEGLKHMVQDNTPMENKRFKLTIFAGATIDYVYEGNKERAILKEDQSTLHDTREAALNTFHETVRNGLATMTDMATDRVIFKLERYAQTKIKMVGKL